MFKKRVKYSLGYSGLVGGMALGAWYMGSRISRRQKWRARTAGARAIRDSCAVESRVLSSDIVTRGTVRFGLLSRFSIAPSNGQRQRRADLVTARPNTNLGRAR